MSPNPSDGSALDRVDAEFERLRRLPPDARAAALSVSPLCDDDRALLARLLAADDDADDPLARAIGASAAAAARGPALRVDRLGPYRVRRELGAGGMGTVLLAERVDGGFAQQVAIKILRGFPTEDGLRRLRQERQILAALQHPHIARLLDGGETADGQPWLAMEFVDGLPLLDHAARRAPRLRERLALFDAMLDAVEHAHQHLIVHRDLKPANVLVTHAGQVKLLDFGVARLVDVDAQSADSTRVFTPGYASPEQRDGRSVTTASDIYSLGVLLRELVTARRADGDAAVAGLAALPLDAELGGIVAKACDADPVRRYASAGALRDDIRRYLDGRPVRAARLTRLYRLRKFVQRHRLGVAAAVLAVLAALVFVWRLDAARSRALAAEAAAQQALAASERDAALAREALSFLTDAFEAASPENAMSREISLRGLLDAARAQLAARTDPVLVKAMQRLLGQLYGDLGDIATSLALMREGLAGVVAADRAQALRLAEDYDEYASALGVAGDPAGALAAADQAAAWRERFAPDDAVARVRTLQSRGMVHHRAGDDEKAIVVLREARALGARTPGLPLDLYIDIAQPLSTLLSTTGERDEALAVVDEALARVDTPRLADSPEHVILLRAKANALQQGGDATQAEQLLRRAIALQQRVIDPGGARMMVLTNDLALVLNELGRYREALESLRRSDRHMGEAGIDGATDRAVSRGNYGGILENAGDYATALEEFRMAREILDEAGIDADHQVRRRIARNEARTLARAGQTAKALAQFEALRERSARVDGKDSVEYAMLNWQLALVARLMHRPETGLSQLDEAQGLWQALVPPEHAIFLHMRRARASFALDRGDTATALREIDAAITGFEASGALPLDLAIARSERAAIQLRRGDAAAARASLTAALPVLRDSLLPAEISRAEAERTAAALGMSVADK